MGAECNSKTFPNCGTLGSDRTPVYFYGPNKSPGNNIRSATTFSNWFHDTAQTKPVNFAIPMSLVGGTGNTYQYPNLSFIHFIFDSLRYINDTFFPLDGIGWQDHCNGHNYAYCFQGSWSFGYQGGEVFSFTGDDDVWVYINGKFDFFVSSSDWKLRLFGH